MFRFSQVGSLRPVCLLCIGLFIGLSSHVQAQNRIAVSSLRSSYQHKVSGLPEGDADAKADLPAWFRAFLRANLSGLPTSGQPRYPSSAESLLSWLSRTSDVDKVALQERLNALQQEVPTTVKENLASRGYSADWEVPVTPGTKLAVLANKLELQYNSLPQKDVEDRSPLPVWFRVYLRKTLPDLPKTGPYQYPKTANRILQDLLDHPNEISDPDEPDSLRK